MTVKLVVADDMDLALEGIKAILRPHSAYQVVATYHQLAEMLVELPLTWPDVILLGDRLEPGLDVLALVERVREAASRPRIVILSSQPDGLIVHELFTVGAAGYLYKGDLLGECLVDALQTVMRGRPYLSPTANAEYLLVMQSDRVEWRLDAEARDVLRLMASGYRPQEIALMHQVPVRRVYSVAEKLRRRFGAETNEHVIARAAEEGFLP